MGREKKVDAETAQTMAAAMNSPAAQKLAEAVKDVCAVPRNMLDYIAGPKRVVDLSKARAEGALIEAKAQAEIDRLRAETADYVLNREMRKTLNRKLIVAEAYKALPPPDQEVSKDAPSQQFIHNFFDEFDGIGEPEMQKIVGRLLAGEVMRPGSYHRKTLRVLRDLESPDFVAFTALCRFVWIVDSLWPLIFEANDQMYLDHGVNFGACQHLDALGLAQLLSLEMARKEVPKNFTVRYGPITVRIEPSKKALTLGQVSLTPAGLQLAALTKAQIVPGFLEFVVEKWRAIGHTVTITSPDDATAAPA